MRKHSGPLDVSDTGTTGDLKSVLAFPKNASARLTEVEEELWDRLDELTRREQEAEALAAQGRPFIG